MRANDVVKWLRRRHGYASTDHIAQVMQWSRRSAEAVLRMLEDEGKVQKVWRVDMRKTLWAAAGEGRGTNRVAKTPVGGEFEEAM